LISFKVELKRSLIVYPEEVTAPVYDGSICEKEFWKDMKKLASMEALADVVIICDGDMEVKAHRSVLAARSPVFEAMFTHDMTEKRSGQVKIPDCKPEAMRNFLHFLYHAKLETYDHAAKLLELADRYQVPTLKELCEIHLLSSPIPKVNAMEMLQLANLHNSDKLKQKAFDVVKLEVLGASFSVPDDFINKIDELQKVVDIKLQSNGEWSKRDRDSRKNRSNNRGKPSEQLRDRSTL